MKQILEIIHQDEDCVAINKPCGVLMHKTYFSSDRDFILQRLRDQINQMIYPVHRLDRATSGVVIFGLTSSAAKNLSLSFTERKTEKTYLAIVRGYILEKGHIDYPLAGRDQIQKKEALTDYEPLAQVELDIALKKYPKARYSLMRLKPKTGRYQQLRRHMAHIYHPIVGDVRHGTGEHNRLFRDHFDVSRLLLHASELQIEHPTKKTPLNLKANLDSDWLKVVKIFATDLLI